jgi:hypothetical protein
MLDTTAALRPSELFALRWMSFDNRNTLSITETVYCGVIRPFGNSKKSLGKMHVPNGLARRLLLCKTECPDSSPDVFIFPNADGGIMRVDNCGSGCLSPLLCGLEYRDLTSRSAANDGYSGAEPGAR